MISYRVLGLLAVMGWLSAVLLYVALWLVVGHWQRERAGAARSRGTPRGSR